MSAWFEGQASSAAILTCPAFLRPCFPDFVAQGDAEPTPAGGGEPIEETAAAAEQQQAEVDEQEPADETEPADRGEGDAELYASTGDGALLEPPTDEPTAEDGADMDSAGGADGGADEVGDEKDAPADEGAEDGYIDDADGEATLEEERGAAYDGAEGEGEHGFADDGLEEEEEEDRGALDEEDEEEDEDGRGGAYDEGEGSDLDDAEAHASGDSANGSARGAGGGEEDGEEGRAAPSAAADDEVLDEEEDEEEAGGLYGDEDEDAYNDFDMGLDGADALAEEQQLSEQELSAQLAERIEAARDEHSARLQANQMLQRKLAEHLRAAKGSEERPQDDATDRASVHEQEARYVKALAQLQTLKGALAQVQERFDAHAAELNTKLTHKEAKAREITQAFAEFKREIMSAAENSRTGRPIAPKLVRMFEDGEKERDEELAQMRLAHISRRTQKEKLEYALRQKEKLADGLHLCAPHGIATAALLPMHASSTQPASWHSSGCRQTAHTRPPPFFLPCLLSGTSAFAALGMHI